MTHPRSSFITAAATVLLALALPALAAPFTNHGDGTVTDDATGLVWDQCSRGQTWSSGPPPSCSGSAATYSWADALAQADAANAAGHRGHRDWRLPNRTELESLIDISQADTANSTAFQTAFPNTPAGWFWSSTTYAPYAAGAWHVDFGNGYADASYKTNSYQVRLVRSGQSFASFDAAAQALTVAVSGGGAVSAGPSPVSTTGGIAGCSSAGGAACAASYTHTSPAAEVTLSASALPGSSFSGWGGACSGSVSTCVVTMDQVQHVTADFALNTYTVRGSASPPEGGSVSCTPPSVTHGGSSTCTVTPNAGYSFGAFSGDCSGPTCSLSNIQSDKTVSASFSADGVKSFSGTTVPPEGGTPGPATASFTGGGSRCGFDSAATAFIAAPAAPPEGKTLPQGLFKFKLTGCDDTPVAMKIEWPETVTSYTKYGKESASAAAASYFQPDGLAISGHSVSFTVRDGQKGDDDWQVNGEIVDPSGPLADAPPPGAEVTPIPTLGEWGLLLLGLLAAGLGARRLRRG